MVRTHQIHQNLYIPVFLRSAFGPDCYVPLQYCVEGLREPGQSYKQFRPKKVPLRSWHALRASITLGDSAREKSPTYRKSVDFFFVTEVDEIVFSALVFLDSSGMYVCTYIKVLKLDILFSEGSPRPDVSDNILVLLFVIENFPGFGLIERCEKTISAPCEVDAFLWYCVTTAAIWHCVTTVAPFMRLYKNPHARDCQYYGGP